MSKLSPIIRITLLCLFLLFVGLELTVSAQQFTGIQGVVQDSTGIVVRREVSSLI